MSDSLAESIDHWEMLAAEQESQISPALVGLSDPARNRALLYRRTANALRLEQTTGQPHCSCCLLPRSANHPEPSYQGRYARGSVK